MPSFPYTVLDVFTDTPLEGNQLAVVEDADGLDDATMLSFARETKLSETTFVQRPTAAGADYRNRIWTVARELPFAGHPSLGTAVVVARRRGLATGRLTQETPAGRQPCDVRLEGERLAYASMLQEPAAFGEEVDPARALGALGLPAGASAPSLPPQAVSTGVPQILVPVCEPQSLSAVSPDGAAVSALLDEFGAVTLYLAHVDLDRGTARARSFSHLVEGGEDPATGSAAGPLGAYVAERTGVSALDVAQGVEMGRPSRLFVEMDGDRVRVGGHAVVIVEGTLSL
jgi:trans-2,3-dihydro-3-hydroxyanthranilate isomerase